MGSLILYPLTSSVSSRMIGILEPFVEIFGPDVLAQFAEAILGVLGTEVGACTHVDDVLYLKYLHLELQHTHLMSSGPVPDEVQPHERPRTGGAPCVVVRSVHQPRSALQVSHYLSRQEGAYAGNCQPSSCLVQGGRRAIDPPSGGFPGPVQHPADDCLLGLPALGVATCHHVGPGPCL